MKIRLNKEKLNLVLGGTISRQPYEACNSLNEEIAEIQEGTWGFSATDEKGNIKFFGNDFRAAIDWDWQQNSKKYIDMHLFSNKEMHGNYYRTIYIYSRCLD